MIISVLCIFILVAAVVLLSQKSREASAAAAKEETERIAQEEADRKQQEALQIQYDRIMHSGLYLQGVTIEGIDVYGMNRPEAAVAIEPVISSHRPTGTIDLVYGDRLTGQVLSP